MNKLWLAERKARIKNRPTGTLENWSYDPLHKVYWGEIHGDIRGRFPDGARIHTSEVDKVKGDLVYTLNSIYKLGKKTNVEPL